jgi:hypothetical protein
VIARLLERNHIDEDAGRVETNGRSSQEWLETLQKFEAGELSYDAVTEVLNPPRSVELTDSSAS